METSNAGSAPEPSRGPFPASLKLESQLQIAPRLIHLVPFLAVILLLLTFYLLGSSMIMQSGIRVQPPTSSSLLDPMPHAQVITLSAGRQPQIYFNDQPVSIGALKSALAKSRSGPRHVLVRADELAAYGWVVKVSQIALDAGYEVVQATSPPEIETANPPP